MKNVLITGADGFIGSHLTESLIKSGYNVRAFCYYNSFNSYGWLDDISPELKGQIDFCLGDIRDFQNVKNAVKSCDTIIHLAALISIPYSYNNPLSFLETNVTGTYNILQAALEHNVSHTVTTSTSEVYGTAISVPINESHPIQPQSPYAASKVSADALALSYQKSYDLPVSVARPFNTFGPRQSTRAVIPTIITQILKGNKEISLGNLKPTRDFLYIDDTVHALHTIAENKTLKGEAYNIAGNDEISIGSVANTIISKFNQKIKVSEDLQRLRPENSEVYRLYGDASKLKAKTNWKPKVSFDDGISKTIAWFSKTDNLKRYLDTDYTI